MPRTKDDEEQAEIAPTPPEELMTVLRLKSNAHLMGQFVPAGTVFTHPKAFADHLLSTTDFYEVVS